MAKQKTNTSVTSVVTAAEAVDISATDHTFSNVVRGLYVGAAGNLTVRLVGDDTDAVFANVVAGTVLPVAVASVRKTGTTAGSILGLI